MKHELTIYPFPEEKPRPDPETKDFSVSVLAMNGRGCVVAYYNHRRDEWILGDEAIDYNSIIEVHGVTAWAYLPEPETK